MDNVSEQRLSEVHPELANRVRQLADSLLTQAITIRVTQGLRTWAQQLALYNQGRTAPGKIVTNAKPGYSAHNFGYAVDIVPMDGTLPDWNAGDANWKAVLDAALNFGLAEGAQWRTFPDVPHLYLKELPADPDDTMRATYEAAGLGAVWEDINKILGVGT
jgi:peptidoglycan L-alanyl-D-glutamate endopeptidase CwlK